MLAKQIINAAKAEIEFHNALTSGKELASLGEMNLGSPATPVAAVEGPAPANSCDTTSDTGA